MSCYSYYFLSFLLTTLKLQQSKKKSQQLQHRIRKKYSHLQCSSTVRLLSNYQKYITTWSTAPPPFIIIWSLWKQIQGGTSPADASTAAASLKVVDTDVISLLQLFLLWPFFPFYADTLFSTNLPPLSLSLSFLCSFLFPLNTAFPNWLK